MGLEGISADNPFAYVLAGKGSSAAEAPGPCYLCSLKGTRRTADGVSVCSHCAAELFVAEQVNW